VCAGIACGGESDAVGVAGYTDTLVGTWAYTFQELNRPWSRQSRNAGDRLAERFQHEMLVCAYCTVRVTVVVSVVVPEVAVTVTV
jgi:hypothetical protein